MVPEADQPNSFNWVAYSILAKTRFSHQLAPFGAKMGAFDAELPHESETKGKYLQNTQKKVNKSQKNRQQNPLSIPLWGALLVHAFGCIN